MFRRWPPPWASTVLALDTRNQQVRESHPGARPVIGIVGHGANKLAPHAARSGASPRQENTGSVSVAHPGKVRNVGGLDSASTPTGSSASSSSSKGSPSGWRATQLPSAHKIAAEARPVQANTYAPPSEAGARGTVVFTHARSRDAPSFTPISPTWPTLAATTPSHTRPLQASHARADVHARVVLAPRSSPHSC